MRCLKWLLGGLCLIAGGERIAASERPEKGPVDIQLSASDRTPELRVAVTVPAGWGIQWFSGGRSSSIARIFHEESKGLESIVIAATPLRASERDKADVFDGRFIREMTENLKARRGQRVRNDFWDGGYFQYEITAPADQGMVKAEVRNWMLTADGYLVQFQCYFLKNFSLETDERQEREDATAALYRDILFSVRRVPAAERPPEKTKGRPRGK